MSLAAETDAGSPIDVLSPPEQTVPVVFASPHSGADYPAEFVEAARLPRLALRRSEDAFVDEIFAAAPEHGAPLLRALFPRAYVDPNREAFELDPDMFAGPLPDWVNTRSPRVRGGLGTIARVVATGAEIYRDKLDFDEAERRIDIHYRPYHEMLARLIEDTRARFGGCLLIDCHSMPSIGGPMDADPGRARVDFVLGDRYGASCAPAVVDRAEAVLAGHGYRVARNAPYAGGYTTAHYGRPAAGVHALQIEINRRLYMDEARITRLPGLAALAARMTEVIAALVRIPVQELRPVSVAADAIVLRPAAEEDMAAIAAIYAHHVETGFGTFEEVAPPLDTMVERWRAVAARGLPYLVAVDGGSVAGYAYAGPYRTRTAYRHTVEDSIYVAPGHGGRGIGRRLLEALIDHTTAAGYRQMIAVIGDSANLASVRLHARCGFRHAGTLELVGYKFGRWVDTVMMQRTLGAGGGTPPGA